MNVFTDLLNPAWDWLLATTLRASALAVAILLLRAVFRTALPARWRHALWLPLIAVLVLPVLLSRPPFAFEKPGSHDPAPIDLAVPAAAPATAEAATPAPDTASFVTWLPLAWAAGALVLLGSGIAGHVMSMRRIARQSTTPDAVLTRAVADAARDAGLASAPRLRISSAVEGPAVTGLLRPTLLLPAGFSAGFTPEQARLILLHECLHVKRLDLPLNALICVLQAVHWFNPLLWFAFSRMRADREAACDAAVLDRCAADHRSDYGHALLKLQGMPRSFPLHLGFVGAFSGRRDLASRIREISRHRRRPLGTFLGVTAIAGLTVCGVTRAADNKPSDRQTPAAKVVPPDAADAAAIVAKLDRITLPAFKTEDLPFPEAVDRLRQLSKTHDTTEPNSEKKGINLVVRMPRPTDGKAPAADKIRVSLDLKNVTLRKAAVTLAQAAKMRVQVDAQSVYLIPADQPRPPVALAPAPVSGAEKQASKIMLPSVSIEGKSLEDAVAIIVADAKKNAGGNPVPAIVIDPTVGAGITVNSLNLRNVPLSIALRYLSEMAKTRITGTDDEIRIMPPGTD